MKKNREEILKRFGKQFKKLREERGLSLSELELRGDINRHYLSELEHGKKNVTFLKLIQLCELLEIQPDEFLKGFKK